jgi:hypothetical protein
LKNVSKPEVTKNKEHMHWAWWCAAVIQHSGQEQEDHEFKASLGYRVRLSQSNNKRDNTFARGHTFGTDC